MSFELSSSSFLPAGGRVDVIRHCSQRCFCFANAHSHSYPVAQSSFSCASAAIEPLIKEPTCGLLARAITEVLTIPRCHRSICIYSGLRCEYAGDNRVLCCANAHCFQANTFMSLRFFLFFY